MTKFAAAILALSLCALCSCAGQPAQMTGRMVDPTVASVASDGKTAKVNIGYFDGVHVGQRLYVVRQNKLIAMLTVRKPETYSSDCLVVASGQVTQGHAANSLGTIHAGDNVFRSMAGLTLPGGRPGEQVPRMVPVPYEPADQLGAQQESSDNNAERKARLVQPPVIPRDQVENWMKTHPEFKTN